MGGDLTGVAADVPIAVMIADDRMVANGLREILEREDDIRVVGVVTCVKDLVEGAPLLRPDVILTAYHFHPVSESVTNAIAMLRESLPETKVVVLTYETDASAILDSLASGSSGFLTKRQEPADLVRAVRAAHAGDIPMDPDLLRRFLDRMPRVEGRESSPLTHRERSVLTLLSEGRSRADIAAGLSISPHTVRNHVQSILQKLGAHSKLEAVVIARRKGLLID